MKEWFSTVGKWFLTQSLAVKCSIIGLGAAVVVGAGAAGYLCLRPEEPREVVNEEVNVSDEAPTEEGQEPATQEPEETGENPTEPVEQNEEEQTEPVEDEEIEEEAYVKTSDKLVNGNFADGINGFEVYSFIPEDISYDVDAKNGFSIDIFDTGEEDWHIQLKQGGIKLQQGKWYQLTLDAKSSMGRSIICSMQRDGTDDDNWISYSGNKNLALTKQWKTYTIIFQMTEKTDKNAIFNLAMGTVNGNRIRTDHTIGIRNIKLEQLADTWLDQLSQGDNLLKNANYAYEDILWEASVVAPGAAKTSFADGKAVFDISNAGTIDWHVQLKQSGITLEQGNGYRLTFKASSSVARAINIGFMDKEYVNWYGGGLVTLGAEQTVTVEFYMDKPTNTDVCMFLSMGKIENVDTPASVITLSDFSLVKVPDMAPTSSNGGGGGGGVNPITNLTDGWFVYDHNDRQVGSCYVDGDNGYRMDIANTGTEEWHIQLQKKNILLEKDKWYRITLDAKSTLDREIGIALQRDGAADEIWTVYSGGDVASLTGEWQTFTKEFKMTSETDPATIYCLSLGSVGGKQISQAHTVWIKNLKLEEIEEPKKDSIALNTEMLDKNAWGSNVEASAGAAATVQYADGKAAFDITNVGTESHHVQFSQSGLMLEKGCKYEFTFRATSTEVRTISVGFLGGDRGWTWYGGDDVTISPISPRLRSAEDGLWRVEFTMKEETDTNATLAISLGMIKGGDIPEGQHTVTLSEFSLKKIAEAGDTPEPGPEGGVIYVKATDPQITDEYGSKWIVEIDHTKYCPDVVQGESKVRITANLYSEKGFEGLLGACGADWSWSDTGVKAEVGGEATWTLEVDSFMGAAQIQINSMEGDCVEIRSIKVEVVTGTEEPDPRPGTPDPVEPTDPGMLTGTWSSYIDNAATAEIKEKDGKQIVTIGNVGSEDYHVQLKQDGLKLEKGCSYKLTFNGSSTQNRTIKAAFLNAEYDWYGGADIELTGTDKSYTVEFTVGEDKATDDNMTLVFSMGKLSNAPAGEHTVTLSNFSLVKTKDAPKPEEPDPGPEEPKPDPVEPTDPGMLSGSWNLTEGVATLTESGGKKIISITGESSNPWDIQLAMYGLNLEKDCTYKLTYNANAGADRTVVVGFQQNGGSYAQYADGGSGNGFGSVNLTATDTKYEAEFTMSNDTDSAAMFYVNMGGGGKGEITFSNFSLVKTKDAPKPENPDADTEMLTGTWGNYVATDQNAEATISEQDGKQVVLITKAGTANWNVQLNQGGLNLEANTSYVFSFNVASTVARVIEVAFQSNTDSWYGGGKVVLPATAEGAELGTYTVNFTMSGIADTNAKIVISMGAVTGGDDDPPVPTEQHTVTLSNFSLKKVN
ncbi:MAG: carbohydrate binding domain-containing protein [Muribaculum sp.]|nr:carbohydrate binding domain-containing protein [Muribaculum sp.]